MRSAVLLILLGAYVAIGSPDSELTHKTLSQLRGVLSGVRISKLRMARLNLGLSLFGTRCVRQAIGDMTPERVDATMAILVPAMDACVTQFNAIPASEKQERKKSLRTCMAAATTDGLDEDQKAAVSRGRACLSGSSVGHTNETVPTTTTAPAEE